MSDWTKKPAKQQSHDPWGGSFGKAWGDTWTRKLWEAKPETLDDWEKQPNKQDDWS